MNFEFRKPKGAARKPTKVCSKCRVEKDVYTDFYWAHGVGSGWPQGKCKKCSAERLIEYRSTRKKKYCEYAKNARLRDPERAKEIQRKSDLKDGGKRRRKYIESLNNRKGAPLACADCGKVQDSKKDYYRFEQPCKKCHSARGRQQRLINPELTKQRRKAEYEADKPRAKARAKQWKTNNPERAKELARRNANTPKGKIVAKRHSWERRALRLKALVVGAPPITSEWFDGLKTEHDNKCFYCCDSNRPLTMDHVIPLKRGGKHIRENIVPSCKSCNCKKSARLISEWRPWIDIPLYGLELASA